MKITTKTGDGGETSLFGGARVRKDDPYIELVGQFDELQSFVAFAKSGITDNEVVAILDRVIDDLYRIMSIVGFSMKCPTNIEKISDQDVDFLESSQDSFMAKIGDLNKFIRPGSSEEASRLNLARTVCRRVEREIVRMGEKMETSNDILKYVNRLSDLLFVLAYKYEKV